jgi:hypothetical protein
MGGLDPPIHANTAGARADATASPQLLADAAFTWMAGSSPAMTARIRRDDRNPLRDIA